MSESINWHPRWCSRRDCTAFTPNDELTPLHRSRAVRIPSPGNEMTNFVYLTQAPPGWVPGDNGDPVWRPAGPVMVELTILADPVTDPHWWANDVLHALAFELDEAEAIKGALTALIRATREVHPR